MLIPCEIFIISDSHLVWNGNPFVGRVRDWFVRIDDRSGIHMHCLGDGETLAQSCLGQEQFRPEEEFGRL